MAINRIQTGFDFFRLSGLIFLSITLLYITLQIKREDLGHFIRRCVRVVFWCKACCIGEIRTMVVGAEGIGASLTPGDDPRITRNGNYLREYELEELSQLINVLRGNMSYMLG